MKRTKLIWISAVLALLLACGSLLTVFAEGNGEAALEEAPAYDLWIYGKNLAMEDSVYIYYAVPVEGTNGADVKMLFWLEPQDSYTYGTQQFELSPERDTMDVYGETCYVFNFKELAAKHMTVDVYARVYVEDENGAHYSELDKYSVLQYCYNMLGKTSSYVPEPELEELLNAMLDYGAMAQKYFKTNTDRLANAEYYQVALNGALLPDGSHGGLYAKGTELTVTVPLTDASGASFSHWEDSKGNKVETTAPDKLVVGDKNETYTPVYVKYSAGLEFESNGDGTCWLLGMGECTDTDLIIPPTALDGDKVTGIDSNAFAGEAITSVSFPSTIEEIGRRAFNNCTSLTDVYYDGTEEEWNEINISSSGNDAILNATKHFKAPAVETFTVTFVDHDGTVLKTESVESGKSATAPANPEREGYTFTGWDKSFDAVTGDLTVMAEYTYAATEPTLFVESVTAGAGDTVTINVQVLGNPGVAGAKINIAYDESKLTLTSAENGEAFAVLDYTAPAKLENGCPFNWDSLDAQSTVDGTVLILTFKIADSVSAGEALSISASYPHGSIYDTNLEDLTFDLIDGIITVQ